jgi:hypothetical protein
MLEFLRRVGRHGHSSVAKALRWMILQDVPADTAERAGFNHLLRTDDGRKNTT